MSKADIAIGACGVTTWERFCLGLPSIVITTANNQNLIAKELQKTLNQILGSYHNVSSDMIYQSIKHYINSNLDLGQNHVNLLQMDVVHQELHQFTLNSKSRLKLRKANINDQELILNWRNEPILSNSLIQRL